MITHSTFSLHYLPGSALKLQYQTKDAPAELEKLMRLERNITQNDVPFRITKHELCTFDSEFTVKEY